MLLRQVNTFVATPIWNGILANIKEWPESMRTPQGIALYALHELANDPRPLPEVVPPVGDARVNFRLTTPEAERQLSSLVEKKYGNGAAVVRVAIARLYENLNAYNEKDYYVPVDGTTAFLRLLAQGRTQAEIIKKTGMDSGHASRVKQGKAQIGPEHTERLRKAFPNAFK